MGYKYIKKLGSKVKRKEVGFTNRYGIRLIGDLYMPISLDEEKKYPAIIVGAPYGGVKEQGPCIYGEELAKKGFIVLTFDQAFMGESAGFPRHVSSPDIFSESFSAAVDFLGVKVPFVDREKIGVIGICGSGGFALSAAQVDTRIKAICTASMYDISRASRLDLSDEEILDLKNDFSYQRWIDYENGYPEYVPFFPEDPIDSVPPGMEEPGAEWFRFYALKRGFHPNARGGFTTTSSLSMMNYNLLSYIKEISPRPILFIVGDKAHSKHFSEYAYNEALEPKEIYEVSDAEHIDLYDQVSKIPFKKIEKFFKDNLK